MEIRLLESHDAAAMHAYHVRNAEAHAPWTPLAGPDYFEPSRYESLLRHHLAFRSAGMEYRFGAFDEDRLLGLIALVAVERGAFQNGRLGYSVDAASQGRGVATAMVGAVCGYAFGTLGLHRLEAHVMPRNAASRRALEKNGFEKCGLAPRLVQIAGTWEDHDLLMRLAEP